MAVDDPVLLSIATANFNGFAVCKQFMQCIISQQSMFSKNKTARNQACPAFVHHLSLQTKVMNEGWACLVSSSLVLTEHGLLRYDTLHELLAHGETVEVGGGNGEQDRIVDRHIRRSAPTIRLRTRRGLVLEGAEEHKLSIGPDQWIALKDVQTGQRIPLSVGENIWSERL